VADKLAGIALFVDQFGVQSPGRAISHAAIITHEAASVAYAEYHICATAFVVVVLKKAFPTAPRANRRRDWRG